MSITGRAGCLDRQRSVTKWDVYDDHKWIAGMRGLYFDVRQWDGSDLFMLRDSDVGCVIVTTRLVAALKLSKITGWDSVPVLKFRMGVQYDSDGKLLKPPGQKG